MQTAPIVVDSAGAPIDRMARIAWRLLDLPIGAQDIPSITWYYATDPTGSDRKRATTLFHESFENGYQDQWLPVNGLRADWDVKHEGNARRGFNFVRGRPDGEPLDNIGQLHLSAVIKLRQ